MGGALLVLYDAAHGGSEEGCSALAYDRAGLRVGIVQHDVSVLIQYFRIELRRRVVAQAGDAGVGRRQVQIRNASCQASERQGLGDVGEGFAAVVVGFHQTGNPEMLRIFEPDMRTQFRQAFYSDDIDGLYDRVTDGDLSQIALV